MDVYNERTCPLCKSGAQRRYHEKTDRHYRWCTNCDLISVAPEERVSAQSEYSRYLEHDNGFHQSGYVRMLTAFLQEVLHVTGLSSGSSLLDFGCGYAPVLKAIAASRGFRASAWDPWFLSNPQALDRSYDAVLACEVVEHVGEPVELFERFSSLLEPQGALAIRSSLHPAGWESFFDFWYIRDRTHISFYSARTVAYCAERFGYRILTVRDPLWILQKR